MAASILAAGSCGARWPADFDGSAASGGASPGRAEVPPAAARARPARPMRRRSPRRALRPPRTPRPRGRRRQRPRRSASRARTRDASSAASALEVFTKEVVKTARARAGWLTWRRGSGAGRGPAEETRFAPSRAAAVAGGGPRAGQDLRRGVVRVRRRASAPARRRSARTKPGSPPCVSRTRSSTTPNSPRRNPPSGALARAQRARRLPGRRRARDAWPRHGRRFHTRKPPADAVMAATARHARVCVLIGDGSEPHNSHNRATSSGENAAPRVPA